MSFVPPGSSFVFRCVYDVVFLAVFRSLRVDVLCTLFNDDVSASMYRASNGWMIVNNEFKKMW
jgi:hypothetical protein